MSQFDKGFAAGLLTAAKLARKASAQVQRAGVGAKFQGAFAALDALAEDLEALTKPEPDPASIGSIRLGATEMESAR